MQPFLQEEQAVKTLVDHLAQYGAYHRDPRNIVTHFIGIPMIVLAVGILLSRTTLFALAGWSVTPLWLLIAASAVFYLRLDLRFGLAMALVLAFTMALGQWFAAQTTSIWLGWGVGLFLVGWVIQFVGHYYEGKKPAFVDDLTGLIVGPLFLVAEAAFMLGLRRDVQAPVEARIGPLRSRTAVA